MSYSGSSYWLARRCPLSAVLPQERPPKSKASDFGSRVHEVLEVAGAIGPEWALATADEDVRSLLEGFDHWDIIKSASLEVPLVYDHETRVVRDASNADGTIDWNSIDPTKDLLVIVDAFGYIGEDAILIVDWKTGWRVDKEQLRLGALLGCRWSHRERAVCLGIQIDEDGSRASVRLELDVFDLADVEEQVQTTYRRVAQAREASLSGLQSRAYTGDHCGRCPAFRACPVQGQFLQRVLAGEEGALPAEESGQSLTPERAADLYARYKAAREGLNKLAGALRSLSFREAIDAGEGSVFGPVTQRETKIDAGPARMALLEEYGPLISAEACGYTMTKASVGRAARILAEEKGTTIKAATESLMGCIEKAGAVEERKVIKVREHKRRG